ncbi:MAG TPA: MFS transporter [Candidatus Binatia bacterium]|nr:MFS transporter [Candidatus Binatia bacterium]
MAPESPIDAPPRQLVRGTSEGPPDGVASQERLAIRRLGLLWLCGLDLRITILAIPPLLPQIRQSLGLSETELAALTTLPVLLMAVVAPLGSAATSRVGPRRTAMAALAVVAVASALRGAGGGAAGLFLLTAVMGAAIATTQPALPALVRHWLPGRAGLATATYVNGMLVGESVAASLTLALAGLTGAWQAALAAWSVPVALAAILLAGRGRSTAEGAEDTRWLPDWRSRRTWELGLLQGAAAVAYFAANTFLPIYLHARGSQLVVASLIALNVCQLPASLAAAALPTRHATGATAVAGLGLLIAAAVGLILAGSAPTVILGAGLTGFATSWTYLIAVTLPALGASPTEAARVSAGMFSIGYTMAFALPVLGGAASDLAGTAAAGFLPGLLSSCIMLALVPAFRGRQRAQRSVGN